MKRIFYFLLLPYLALASNYPYFDKEELIYIEKKSGKISKNRALHYQQKCEEFKVYDKQKQINIVNRYLNQLLPQYDAITQKQEDHWATPKEFLAKGYGDCEDYVIIKYFTLIKLGFDEKKLFITTAFEKFQGGYHMVLSYFHKQGKPPLILDNLSFRVLNLKDRKDLQADKFINSSGVYEMDENYELRRIARHSKEYLELMQRINKEN